MRSPILALAFSLLAAAPSYAHPCASFNNPPEIKEWYANIKMPDSPSVSCCGEADGYYCDDYHYRGDQLYCTITDERADACRNHVPIGSEILIPPQKLNRDPNPVGHTVVFLGQVTLKEENGGEVLNNYIVYCFIPGSGV